MCVCPPSYQDRHHAVLLTRCLPASPPSPCRPTAMPSCDTHALSMVRAHVCAFSCLSVPVRFRPMCVSSVLFLVDFFVHASPHQLWRHCRNFLEQQTGFLSQRTAFVCVVSVFIAVGFKNLLNPAKVKYHHLQTPPSYLFFILTHAAPPPLLSLCSFSLPSSFPAAPLLTSSLFLLRHPPLSCRLGLAPAAVVLLSPLVRTPNRAWIWKTTPRLLPR